MPYFLYRISPERKLTLLETFEKFQAAKGVARRLRAEQAAGDAHRIRMIPAANREQAQRLLTDLRNPKTDGDD